ncbi:hypothetical protein ATL17_1615 [Maritalea mobilis]|uniref:Uncharacterized protein n=2 Tax=Maritalea mobilis TaxID=483324 RepID=A0A4R6VJD2_9HYPH|nr:hypothetical protein ATL17_1615 [Maritalea mobilis]
MAEQDEAAFAAASDNGHQSGLTAQEYAAIQLKVPNSGTEWLDEMIEQSLRNDFAGQALANMASFHAGDAFDPKNVSKAAYQYADAMLQARSESDG